MTPTVQNDLLAKTTAARQALDAWTREIVQWHFDPETGCPFWLEYARELDWDPRKEIRTYDDLDRLTQGSSSLFLQSFAYTSIGTFSSFAGTPYHYPSGGPARPTRRPRRPGPLACRAWRWLSGWLRRPAPSCCCSRA